MGADDEKTVRPQPNLDPFKAGALKLWREAGIRVLPGAYMCGTKDDDSAPGKPYIRIALVDDPPMTEVALSRLVEVLQ